MSFSSSAQQHTSKSTVGIESFDQPKAGHGCWWGGREGTRTMLVLGGIGNAFSISLLALPEQEGQPGRSGRGGRGWRVKECRISEPEEQV